MTWLVSGALLIAFASYVALPLGLAWYMPQLAARHGVRLDVERVRVEPFGSTLRFHGVGIAPIDGAPLRWSSIVAQVDPANLLSGRLVLDGIRLTGSKLHAAEPEMGVYDTLARVSAALPGGLSVGEVVVADVELEAVSEAAGHAVAIERLRIATLDAAFRPEGTEIEANLSVAAGHIRFHGRLNLDETAWMLGAELGADGIPLGGLSALLGAGDSGRGRLGGEGPVRLVYAPNDSAYSVTTFGRWAIDGPGFGLAQADLSGTRVDWNGTAFVAGSGNAISGFGVAGEVEMHEPRLEIPGVLDAVAPHLVLRVDAARNPEPRMTLDGRLPVLRLDVEGGGSEAAVAEAGNLVSRVALTFGDTVEVDVETLSADTLDVKLALDRSIDMEQVDLEKAGGTWGANALSVAAGTAVRADWRGFDGPHGTGTAFRIALEGVERPENGGLRFALASAATVEDRNDGSDLRLDDVVLESAELVPAGSISFGGARISEARLAGAASTLVLEGLDLNGVELDGAGAVSIESGQARVVDHTRTGTWVTTGTGLALAGGTATGEAWTARSVRLDAMEVGTADASWALSGLVLAEATGAGAQASARFAGFDEIEFGLGGHRAVVADLSAESPAWHEGAVGARSIEAVSTALDTVQRHRWHFGRWRLAGVERTASGHMSADTASLESLVLTVAGGSSTGAREIEIDGPSFDGESVVHAAGVVAEWAYHRARDGTGIDIAGLSTGGVEWNGGTLTAERGAAPLMSMVAGPARSSFDGVVFSAARMDAGGGREFTTLSSESGRGRIDEVLQWSAGALVLEDYRAPAYGGATIEFVETRDLDLTGTAGDANNARVRAERASARTLHVEPSGETTLAGAEAEGVTVRDTHARDGISARALRASPLTIRASALEIGALRLAGIESVVAVSETGDWELPALPIGTGAARSTFAIRVREAGVAEPGAVVRVIDRTAQPAFSDDFVIDRASLRGFDSAALGVPARFSVEASAGVFTALHAGGALVPTATGTDLDVNATIRGLSLRDLSPYARLHLGLAVERGQADVDLEAALRTSDLEGTADFILSDVVFGAPGPPADASGAGVGALPRSPRLWICSRTNRAGSH